MQQKPIAAGKSSFELVDAGLVFSELGIKDKKTFLDIACGMGRYSIAAAKIMSGESIIYAVDLWDEGIAVLKNAAAQESIKNIKAMVCDVSKHIPVADHSIDVCLMATVLHDLKQDGTADGTLRETARVLKGDGLLGIVEFKKIDQKPGPPIHIRLSPEELENLVVPYGFRLLRTITAGQFNYLSIFSAGK